MKTVHPGGPLAVSVYAGTDARTRASLPMPVARIKFATESVVFGARRMPPKCVCTHACVLDQRMFLSKAFVESVVLSLTVLTR